MGAVCWGSGRGSTQTGFLGYGEEASLGGRLDPTVIRRVTGQTGGACLVS